MFGEKQLREIADRTLAFSEADETEAVVFGLEERLTRFANNEIHQNVAESDMAIAVRVALGKRVGTATTNDVSDEGLRRAVEQATAAARLRPEDPDFPGLPEPEEVEPVVAFDEPTATYGPGERARVVGEVCRIAQAEGAIASGAFRTAVHEVAVANSHGLFVYHPATIADFTTVVMTDDSAGYSAGASWTVGELSLIHI